MNVKINKVIIGHSHRDCLGGLEYLHNKGIESISGDKTKQKCIDNELPIATLSFSDKMLFEYEREKITCQYFGGGHTSDNIVVYFQKSRILFGGCFIRSLSSKRLGYTKESVIEDWDRSIVKLQKEFSGIKLVIPGHGKYGDIQLLNHTIKLVENHRKNAK